MDMSNVTEYLHIAQRTVKPYYTQLELEFNTCTESIDFGLFCIVYSVCFLVIVKFLFRPIQWKARNREIKSKLTVI